MNAAVVRRIECNDRWSAEKTLERIDLVDEEGERERES